MTEFEIRCLSSPPRSTCVDNAKRVRSASVDSFDVPQSYSGSVNTKFSGKFTINSAPPASTWNLVKFEASRRKFFLTKITRLTLTTDEKKNILKFQSQPAFGVRFNTALYFKSWSAFVCFVVSERVKDLRLFKAKSICSCFQDHWIFRLFWVLSLNQVGGEGEKRLLCWLKLNHW